ncbi:conserved Plasmodium protein, unknown function [Plasmodium ovale]|uniref:ER membrane protein complex subunit 7 beta-sandwich domain-containing protein n=2 Tax=Plasmodium ovale TaxID=36330 RepID=A0A1A8W8J8_PLAOA|nr:conserved Plasmodium protein, unknown function [Plasmodium ovale curtisi]SBS97980.1 conserved Plasmodium protein, unknown function [Plasmodium ovale curtisi]SCQ16747.1 conserved Plasmodium protein, unknown function [Plasmodium ovale]
MNFVTTFLLATLFYFHIIIRSRCEENFVELKNNYIEGIVKANLNVLAECTIYLNSDTYTKPKSNGQFIFTNVNEGVYNMYVNHPYIEFTKFQVEVKRSVTQNNHKIYIVQAYELISPFEKSNLMVTNIIFEVKKVYDFLIPKKNFYLFNLFKSPIFLIFLFFLILLSVVPQVQKMSDASSDENLSHVTYKSAFLEALK